MENKKDAASRRAAAADLVKRIRHLKDVAGSAGLILLQNALDEAYREAEKASKECPAGVQNSDQKC